MQSHANSKFLQASHDILSFVEQSKSSIESLVDEMPNIFGIVEQGGRILKGNRKLACLLGCEPEDTLNKNIFSLFSDKNIEFLKSKLLTIEKASESAEQFELSVTNADVTFIYAWNIKKFTMPADSSRICFSIFGVDVTGVKEKERENAILESELEAARAVQDTLLPQSMAIPQLEMETHYCAAARIGGDWYGYHYDPERSRAFFYVGDVTGHGFASGLVTGLACGAILAIHDISNAWINKDSRSNQISEMMQDLANTLNRVILLTGARCDRLMTLVFACLELDTGSMTVLNAAHVFPLWKKSAPPCRSEFIKGSGNRLGYTEAPRFTVSSVTLEKDDVIFMYTDGLVENTHSDERGINPKRLKQIVEGAGSLEQTKEMILEAYKGSRRDDADDDVSFLLFRWLGNASGNSKKQA